MGILIWLLALAMLYLGMRLVFMSGFAAGEDYEARRWINAIDALFIPNWQSLPIQSEEVPLDSDKLRMANQLFVAAYNLAVDHIKKDIVEIRREQLIKVNADQPRISE